MNLFFFVYYIMRVLHVFMRVLHDYIGEVWNQFEHVYRNFIGNKDIFRKLEEKGDHQPIILFPESFRFSFKTKRNKSGIINFRYTAN